MLRLQEELRTQQQQEQLKARVIQLDLDASQVPPPTLYEKVERLGLLEDTRNGGTKRFLNRYNSVFLSFSFFSLFQSFFLSHYHYVFNVYDERQS